MSRCPTTSQVDEDGLCLRHLVRPEFPGNLKRRVSARGDELRDPVEAVRVKREPLGDQGAVVGDRRAVARVARRQLHHLGLSQVRQILQ